MTETQVFNAIYKRALTVLGRRDCSQRQLRAALLNLKKWYPKSKLYKEYTSDRVDRVIKELVTSGLLNEKRALRNMVESAKTGAYGLRRIKLRMIRQNYPREYIEEVLSEYSDFSKQQDYTRVLRMARTKRDSWTRKFAGDKKKLATVRQRLVQFFAQKGFTMDVISKLLSEL